MPRSTVASIMRRYCINGTTKLSERRGSKPKLSTRAVRLLLKHARVHRFDPLYVIATKYRQHTGIQLSINTVRRYLHQNGIDSYVAVSKPYLSDKKVKARIRWDNMHLSWAHSEWDKVAFSDDSSFTEKPAPLRKRLWRKEGGRYRTVNVIPTFKSGYVCISVWAAFSVHGRTPLIRINDKMNQESYKNVLQSHLLPFTPNFHNGFSKFVFQQDNCGADKAKSVRAYMDATCISLMEWPAQSPDLNPIENSWALLKRRLRLRTRHPTNADNLFDALLKEWNLIPDSYFSNLIRSMSIRVLLVRKLKRRSTKY